MQDVVLVVPAESYRGDDFLRAAERTGYDLTVITDAKLPLPGQVMNVSSLSPSATEVDRLVSALFERSPSLVIGVDEASARLAARLSDLLGLTVDQASAVERATDKASLRNTLATHELTQPTYRVTTLDQLAHLNTRQLGELASALGSDLIVKPTRSTASRGVIRVAANSLAETLDVLNQVMDADDPLLIESYVEGPEYAIEGFLTGGKLEVLMIFEKPDIGEGPYFWESTYLGPARLEASVRHELITAVERGANALGLDDTPIHAELRLSRGAATILEIAPRSIGGRCAAAIRFSDGRRLEDIILARALGDERDAQPYHGAIGIYMIPTPVKGVFREVKGLDDARSVAGVTGVEITVNTGTIIFPPPLTDRYLGFIFAQGPGRAFVNQALATANALLTIVIDPVQ